MSLTTTQVKRYLMGGLLPLRLYWVQGDTVTLVDVRQFVDNACAELHQCATIDKLDRSTIEEYLRRGADRSVYRIVGTDLIEVRYVDLAVEVENNIEVLLREELRTGRSIIS